MKYLIIAAALLLPTPALAEGMDVIQVKLKPGCDVTTYMAIMTDFNKTWGKAHGYSAQLAIPVHHTDLTTLIWIGTTANAETFGKAWDAWRDAQSDTNSVAAKIQARFTACSENTSRRSYDVF